METIPGRPGLWGRSYWALIVTQFLGAFNDNAFKMIVMLFVSGGLIAAEGGAKYLAASTATFAIAYILFSSAAGYLADRFSKRTILVLSKVAEVVVMGAGFFALLSGDRVAPILVLFLMAVQSTFFSPAKYGILPEILRDEELSQGNGIINMTTYLAIIFGSVAGGWLMEALVDPQTQQGPIHYAALVFLGIAALGTATSLLVRKVPAAGSHKTFRWNFLADSLAGVRRVREDRPLFLAMLANMYAWFFGAVFLQNFVPYGREVMNASHGTIGTLIGALCVGIAVGSVLAGKLSHGKIEFGLVPFGAVGMALCALAFTFVYASVWLAGANLVLMGVFTGLYVVPLNAYVQHRSPRTAKGDNIAVLNFITFAGVLVGAVGVYALAELAHLDPTAIFVALGVVTLGATVYICRVLPDVLIRFVVWLLTQTIYRIRVVGAENVPKEGPALLVCNHASFIDAALVSACLQRPVRFLMYRAYYEHPWLHWAARHLRAIPLAPEDGPKALVAAFREARRALVEDGDLVCIFPEGAVTRTGSLLGFRSGFERILRRTDVPIVPVHLDRLWGSVFSFEGGKVLWKRPRAIPYPVTVSFGKPMPAESTAFEVRAAVAELGAEAFVHRREAGVLLHHAFIRAAKSRWRRACVADSSGAKLTCGGLLVAAMLFARRLKKLARGDDHVGVLLPPSVGGVVVNVAALLAGEVPVNLNYTSSAEAMRSAMERCDIRRVVTSRRFIERADLEPLPEMVMIEDLVPAIGRIEKAATALAALLLPGALLRRLYGRRGLRPTDPATVVFSSGSTGTPKGVVLSHRNIASNIAGCCEVLDLRPGKSLCGVLPFFHSFGFTVTLWAPLLRSFRVVYHSNPLDGKTIGRLVREGHLTHLVSTPTFLAAYTRQCGPDDFRSLEVVITGAETLRPRVADAFERKFGIRPLEGYGCTELSPVVAVNVPDRRDRAGEVQVGTKEGTIGRPLPNVAVKVVGLETGEALPPNEEGMLLVKGPNVMLGYLGEPEKTAEVLVDGWYKTGDLARIDEDGFITITDRVSRFSKVGGEMVPHGAVEEAMAGILGVGGYMVVVTSVPDERRGERLAVVHTRLPMSVEELRRRLNESGLPRLWIPRREMFFEVPEIPLLGSGKVSLREVREIAAERARGRNP